MKINNWMRATAFLVTAQFLNVQISTAFGNQAMAEMTPEYQHAMAQAETKLGNFLGNMSEEAQTAFVYKMYKLGVKARNRVNKMSEEKFEHRMDRLASANTAGAATQEEAELAQEMGSINELSQLNTAMAGTEQGPQAPVMTSKESFLNQIDPALASLGSKESANGKFSIASKAEFKKNLNELNAKEQASQARSPATSSFLKLLLKILIITAAVIVVAVVVSMVLIFLSTAIYWLFISLVVGGLVILVSGVHIRIRL